MDKLTVVKEYQIHGSVYFKYAGKLEKDEAMKLQKSSGYHPSGYGFYGYAYDKRTDTSVWECQNCCD